MGEKIRTVQRRSKVRRNKGNERNGLYRVGSTDGLFENK